MSEIELKACPFCGGKVQFSSNRDWHRIEGQHADGCFFDGDWLGEMSMVPATDDAKQFILEAWNTRAPQWKRIESAPKDGTRVLLWDSAGDGRAITGAWRVDSADDHETFTHWQPLPTPPEVDHG